MIKDHLNNFISNYPSFTVKEDLDNFYVLGSVEIIGDDNVKWDEYEIKICIPKNGYPFIFPTLFEIGGKIPNNPDWHTFPDGSCCVAVRPIMQIHKQKGIDINNYYNEFVIPYLANQTYRRLTGSYANGEYDHGQFGIEQYYKELLGEKDFKNIKSLLVKIYNNNLPNRTSKCFCGSKKKYRHCHKKIVNTIKDIGVLNVYNDLKKYI